jgi:hypothetical protein
MHPHHFKQILSALRQVHDAAHLNREETCLRLIERFYIPDMDNIVRQYIATCPSCQAGSVQTAPRMTTYIRTDRPFEMVRSVHAGSACGTREV